MYMGIAALIKYLLMSKNLIIFKIIYQKLLMKRAQILNIIMIIKLLKMDASFKIETKFGMCVLFDNFLFIKCR